VIARLTGTLLEKHVSGIVVDVAGVGYGVLVPLSTFYAVGEPGAPVALRIHTHVREDALQLYGFATELEEQLFERLIGVSGIGPKLALSILSGIESADLVAAIRDGNVARLTKVPGIGRKTAERLVIELRDRLPDGTGAVEAGAQPATGIRDDLFSALANLGYQRHAIEKTVEAVLTRGTSDFEPALREILRELSRR
jgi:Holliday junction DNA helicase RuvA